MRVAGIMSRTSLDAVFVRKVERSSAGKSHGIEREVTEELTPKKSKRKASPLQIQLFEPVVYQLADRIRGIDIDNLRPMDALKLLTELQEELKRP